MEALKVAVNQLWSLLTHTFSFIMVILNLCITLLYLIFILLDYEKLSEGWIKLIPKRSRRFASALVGDVQHGMNSYFRGQALVAFLVGILFSIGSFSHRFGNVYRFSESRTLHARIRLHPHSFARPIKSQRHRGKFLAHFTFGLYRLYRRTKHTRCVSRP